jgi:hypothetical protein
VWAHTKWELINLWNGGEKNVQKRWSTVTPNHKLISFDFVKGEEWGWHEEKPALHLASLELQICCTGNHRIIRDEENWVWLVWGLWILKHCLLANPQTNGHTCSELQFILCDKQAPIFWTVIWNATFSLQYWNVTVTVLH